MILNRSVNGIGNKPWEGELPLTANTLVNFFSNNSTVTQSSALSISAVYRSTNIIAGKIAGGNKIISNADGSFATGKNLLDNPNPMIDAYVFWEIMQMNVMFSGNAYAIISRESNGVGPISALTPVDPANVTPKSVINKQGQIIDVLYEVQIGEERVGISSDEMFHYRGMGTDIVAGDSIIKHGARVLQNALNNEEFAEKFYGSGSLLSGILTSARNMTEAEATSLKNRWREKIQGIKNAFDIVVLDKDTTFQPISLSPADAQFIESRRFSVEEVGRMFGIPNALLNEAGGEKGVDPEKIAILLVQFTLKEWGNRLASAINRQLLPSDKSVKIPFNGIILADERTRSSASVMWRKSQVMSINEIRVAEGLSPIEDPNADDPMYIAEVAAKATDPGTNLGNEEQMTPNEADPEDENPLDMNDDNDSN